MLTMKMVFGDSITGGKSDPLGGSCFLLTAPRRTPWNERLHWCSSDTYNLAENNDFPNIFPSFSNSTIGSGLVKTYYQIHNRDICLSTLYQYQSNSIQIPIQIQITLEKSSYFRPIVSHAQDLLGIADLLVQVHEGQLTKPAFGLLYDELPRLNLLGEVLLEENDGKRSRYDRGVII